MRANNQGDDRVTERTGDETPTLRCEPMPVKAGDSGGAVGPPEAPPEGDDRALEEAGYGYGV